MNVLTPGSLGGVDKDHAAFGATDDIVESIEQSFSQLFVLVKGTIREAAQTLGPDVQPAAWTVLRHVLRHEATSAGAIAAATGMDKSVVSRQLKELRERGLVAVEPDPSDARAVRVTGTEEARRRVATVREGWSTEFREILGSWREDELQSFAVLLERFVASNPLGPRRDGG
jgi:DNA-binding MarR family transcriptional regulator